MRFRSPLILPKLRINTKGNNSRNNLNTYNDNSFGCRFSILKQSYLSSNINILKKSNSQFSYNSVDNNNNSLSKNLIESKINEEDDLEKKKRKFIL